MSPSNVRRMALALLACASLVPTQAVADGWFREMHEVKEVTLAELLRNPHEYREIEVTCKLYFNEPGRQFNPYYTRFIPEVYKNFSAWPFDARLYEKRDFQRSYPHFYMNKENREWAGLAELERITSIEVHAVVRDVFRGQPWIEVLSWDTLGDGLREKDVRSAARAEACYAAGRYDEAARNYDRAIRSSLPPSVLADLYRRLGDAEYGAGDYGDAEDAYERALKHAPGSAVLERNVLAARQAYERRRGSRGADATDETIAPRTEPVAPGERSGVDEIVTLFETPAAVEAEVERYRREIEERAAMVQAEAGVVPVSGQDDGEEKEAAAGGEEQPDGWTDDGCAEEVDVVEVPAEQETEEEPCAEVEEEGCAEESRPEENEAGEEWEGQEWEEEAPAAAEEPCAAEACAEEPAPAIEVVETPVEQPEETKPRTFAEVLESQGEAGTDGCAVAIESEDEVPAAAEEVAEEAPAVEEPAAEPCGEEQAEEWVEETPDMEPCGEEQAESGVDVGVVEMTEEDAATTEVADFESDDPRVVMVAGSMVRLPRMPFFGCEDVSYEDFRAVVEEILRSPE